MKTKTKIIFAAVGAFAIVDTALMTYASLPPTVTAGETFLAYGKTLLESVGMGAAGLVAGGLSTAIWSFSKVSRGYYETCGEMFGDFVNVIPRTAGAVGIAALLIGPPAIEYFSPYVQVEKPQSSLSEATPSRISGSGRVTVITPRGHYLIQG